MFKRNAGHYNEHIICPLTVKHNVLKATKKNKKISIKILTNTVCGVYTQNNSPESQDRLQILIGQMFLSIKFKYNNYY